MNTWFKLEKKKNDIGQVLDTIVQCAQETPDGPIQEDDWCTVVDLDNLFNACTSRWERIGT